MTDFRIINDHIVFTHPRPAALQSIFPHAKQAVVDGVIYLAVENTLGNAIILRNLGAPAPSPIRTQYKWVHAPTIRGPRWYQVDTAEAMTLNKRFFCLNKPRTGKTLSSLWAADYLMNLGVINKTLIVAPISTLNPVWEQNIFVHFPKRRFVTLYGSAQKRKDLLAQDADFYIVNHHGIEILLQELALRPDINLYIIDEIAKKGAYRNSKTKMWKAMKALITPERWVWGLTGSPTPQGPTDAYAQAKLVRPENVPYNYTKFRDLTMQQFGPFRWVPRIGSENVVAKALSPSICFPRTVCTDMEPCFIDRTCELSVEQHHHFKKLHREMVTTVNGTQVSAVNAAILVSKLIQACCGVMYGPDGKTCEIDFGPRLELLEEMIEENDEKILVMVPFTGVLDAVARELRKRWTVEIVDGGVSKNKRDVIFRNFQSTPNPHILVAHPECMAHGLDLTAASLTIWYAPAPSNDLYDQANCRTDGSAQTKKIDIAHIYATNVEKRAYQNHKVKGSWQDVMLDIIKEGAK